MVILHVGGVTVFCSSIRNDVFILQVGHGLPPISNTNLIPVNKYSDSVDFLIPGILQCS